MVARKESWKALSDLKLEEAKKDMSSMEGWELLKKENGISGYCTTIPNDPNKKVKGGGAIKTNMSPRQFMEWIDEQNYDKKKRKIYDPVCNFIEVLQDLEPKESTSPTVTAPWVILHYHKQADSGSALVSNRDALLQVRTIHENDNLSYRISFSLEPDAIPERQPAKGYVRMNCKLSAWVVEQKKDGELEVWYLNHTDPCGMVPAWIANARLTEGSLAVLKCKTLIEGK